LDTITILERFGRLSGLGKETEMKRDEVLAILDAHREELQKLGVKSLSLFGSVARDEAHADSDVDLLVEFNRQGGFFQLLQVQYYLEDILGCSVDLGTQDALREHLREPVLEDVINAF
jgi:predicted nucleotidyltransferase